MSSIDSVCVYCGSGFGANPRHRAAAQRLGELLGRNGIQLVYGGGRVGLMGVVAEAVLAQGGRVIGVIPEHLQTKEVGHLGLTELRVVPNMHERKELMFQLSDGFVILPGGFGTFDELCEILTWAQLGIHSKPIGLLNTAGFFDQLNGFLDFVMDQGFIRPEHRSLLIEGSDPVFLLDALAAWQPTTVAKWADATAR